jgi:GNAT superfamily N-acetyltransferase
LVSQKAVRKTALLFYQNIELDIWVIDLSKIEDYEPRPQDSYRCKYLREEDLVDIESQFGKQTSEDFARRMKLATCYLILEEKEIIGYSWSSVNKVEREGVQRFLFDVHPKNNFVYLYGDFVIPAKRGKGVNRRLMHYRLSEVRKKGFEKGFGLITNINAPQIKIVKTSGLEIVGRAFSRRYLWHVVQSKGALEEYCR